MFHSFQVYYTGAGGGGGGEHLRHYFILEGKGETLQIQEIVSFQVENTALNLPSSAYIS